MKHPPLTRVATTGSMAQMAMARAAGSIGWAQVIRDRTGQERQGILLWDSVAAAAADQIARRGYPCVVCEIDVAAIDLDLLERVDPAGSPARQWIYPAAIEFDRVWWHQYTQQEEHQPWTQPAVNMTIIGSTRTPEKRQPLPTGVITLDA